jgi:hypothetical protein
MIKNSNKGIVMTTETKSELKRLGKFILIIVGLALTSIPIVLIVNF